MTARLQAAGGSRAAAITPVAVRRVCRAAICLTTASGPLPETRETQSNLNRDGTVDSVVAGSQVKAP
jgi:hypothetical protein